MVVNLNSGQLTSKKRSQPYHDWTRASTSEGLTEFQRFTRDDVDWHKSPLGPMAQWPPELRQMVLIIMADPSPAVVYFGHPDDVAIVYNEPYTALIGSKHPKLQGQLARVEFAEVWDYFDNLLRVQMETGQTSVGEAHKLLLHRHGFLEESYFTFKFVPIISPVEGICVGSHATVTEHTAEILAQRRMATAQRLGREVAQAKTLESVWRAFITGLGDNEYDLPLIILFSAKSGPALHSRRPSDSSGAGDCFLQGTLGIEPGHRATPSHFDLGADEYELAAAFRNAKEQSSPLVLRGSDGTLPSHILHDAQLRGHGIAPNTALVCALRDDPQKAPIGFLVLGLNPHRPYDALYEDFIRLITEQVTTPHVIKILLQEQAEADRKAATQAALERLKLDEQLAAKTAAFEHSELKFSKFADSLSMGVGIFDQDGHVAYCNPVWRQFVGLDEQEEGRFHLVKCAENDHLELARKLWADLEAGKAINSVLRLNTRWTAPDGELYPMTALITAYTSFDSKGLMSVVSCIADVSELKWIEGQLRKRTIEVEHSELRYRRLADHAPVGVWTMGQDWLVQFTNDSFSNMVAQPMLSKNILSCIHSDDVERVNIELASLVKIGSAVTFECRLATRVERTGGSLAFSEGLGPNFKWVLISAHLEEDAGIHVVCWMTDITTQKTAQHIVQRKMEEALETKRQQERFIDMTSHEIRNPLSALIHCTDEIIEDCTLANDGFVQNTLEAARTIEYCAKHIGHIVGDVLTLSKLDSRLINILPTPVMPGEVISNGLKMFAGELRAKAIELIYHEHESLRHHHVDWLLLDPSRVVQVLVNLVTNAIKFTSTQAKRTITVTVEVSTHAPPTCVERVSYIPRHRHRQPVPFKDPENSTASIYLVVSVDDTGIGLADEEKTQLFKRFTQANPKTESQYGGFGLGLFVSRDLTELHGGGIGFVSEPGVGSKFVFFVEAKHTKAPEGAQSTNTSFELQTQSAQRISHQSTTTAGCEHSEATPMPDPNHHKQPPELEKKKILIVEDNLINLKVLERQLRKRGYQVTTAIHGEEALKSLRLTSACRDGGTDPVFHVVLMDIEMPIMDGITCVKEIRAMELSGRLKGHLPVIAVTANVRDELTKRAKEAGVDSVATKPYKIEDLVVEIERVCSLER